MEREQITALSAALMRKSERIRGLADEIERLTQNHAPGAPVSTRQVVVEGVSLLLASLALATAQAAVGSTATTDQHSSH